ncbi:MAG: enoyl-CoA hydratase/isomerase family protein [Alphaproteobacteria bacterium]|nr:MAG: enoyl-CoA hydratase/isomerase family protein [Alphaproteobacteria bacterium]
MEEHEFFQLERQGPVTSVSINRPDKRNALTPEMLLSLRRIAESFRVDKETRAVIFRSDCPDFSVGADISRMDGETPTVELLRRTAENGALLMRALREIHQPTLCIVRGVATGGGACIPSACDFRYGTPDARIGYGEVKLGINLMWHALPLTIQAVGLSRAKQMVMTGDLFDAETMCNWGFLDEIIDAGSVDEHVMALAQKYAALPPIAVQMIKRSANAYAGALDQAVMHADADQWLLATRTEDFCEGLAAFRDKRPPGYKGN